MIKMRNNQKIEKELKGKIVLITGGAGSLGSKLTKRILQYPVKSVRVLDIDEHALFKLGKEIQDKRLRLLLGNILDKERVAMAGNQADIIFHVAAIKILKFQNLIQLKQLNLILMVQLI